MDRQLGRQIGMQVDRYVDRQVCRQIGIQIDMYVDRYYVDRQVYGQTGRIDRQLYNKDI